MRYSLRNPQDRSVYRCSVENRMDGLHVQSLGWLHQDRQAEESAVGVRLLLCRKVGEAEWSGSLGRSPSTPDDTGLLAKSDGLER
jgi:hypothetical protein